MKERGLLVKDNEAPAATWVPADVVGVLQRSAPASWPALTEAHVAFFTKDINRLRAEKTADNLPLANQAQSLAEDRRDRVKKALRVLIDDLPTMVEHRELVSYEADSASAILKKVQWLWENAQ